jgi:hypothetical protein
MTKITLDVANILKRKYPGGFHAPADIDIDTFLEFADDDWEHEIDLDTLLARDGQVALLLSTEDVYARRPDLTHDQAMDVLRMSRGDFLRDGCHLDFIESTAEGMYARRAKRYRVQVRATTIESYEVEADSEEDAGQAWEDGRLCGTDDSEPCEVLSIEEVLP